MFTVKNSGSVWFWEGRGGIHGSFPPKLGGHVLLGGTTNMFERRSRGSTNL